MNSYSYYQSEQKIDSNSSMAKVFGWLFFAILLTALTSVGVPLLLNAIGAVDSYGTLVFVSAIVLILLSFLGNYIIATSRSKPVVITVFSLYSISMGMGISPVILSYSLSTIVYSLFITAGVFGIMALYGFITKRDLSGFGSFLIMLLLGSLFISLINIFIANEAIDWILSYVILGLYIGLIAFDVQRLKRLSQSGQMNINMSLLMALNLYIDFVYIFIRVLSLVARNRD